MTANGHVLLRPGDLTQVDFSLVRRGYDPVTVQGFLHGPVKGTVEELLSQNEGLRKQAHDAEVRATQLNELLHGRDIDADAIMAEQAENLAAQCLADAQWRGEQHEARVKEHCAGLLREAGVLYDTILHDAENTAKQMLARVATEAQEKAGAAAAQARAASPPGEGQANADLAAEKAWSEAYKAGISGEMIVRTVAESLAEAASRVLQVLNTRQPPATTPAPAQGGEQQ